MEYNFPKIPPSLAERACVQLAVCLCQQRSFKTAILCLEDRLELGEYAFCDYREKRLEKWDAVVEEQSKILCGSVTLPALLMKRLSDWISRIALEYLCWCRRLEVLFGLHRFNYMDFPTIKDWTCEGRLDEKKLCERLVQDENLTIKQRFSFACAYFCFSNNNECWISELWNNLSEEDKYALTYPNGQRTLEKDNIVNHLVKMWSLYLVRREVPELNSILLSGIEEWTDMGNYAIVKRCWDMVSQECQRTIIIDMGLRAVIRWYRSKWNWWRLRLVNPDKDKIFLKRTYVPSCYYTELVCFYLSHMTNDERMTFFLRSFTDTRYAPVLECFLEWNYQKHFIPTISCLWGVVPSKSFVKLLLTVASKYTGIYDDKVFSSLIYKREDRYFDYGFLLLQLWNETPYDLKRFLFSDQETDQAFFGNQGHCLLLKIIKKHPLEIQDIELFKYMFTEVTEKEKNILIYSQNATKIFSILIKQQRFDLVDWILTQSLPNIAAVSDYKKQFMQSKGRSLCFYFIGKGMQRLVDSFFEWAFTTP